MMRHLWIAWISAQALLSAGSGNISFPLFFIENQGQAAPAVRFMAQGSGLTAWFSPDGALFRVAGSSVRLEFPGADPAVKLEGIDPLEARADFLTGAEDQWRVGVPTYGAVLYRDLYPGIHMVYGANGRNLKSEFVVAPGADPALIRLRYSGAGIPWVDPAGALVIPVDGQQLREQAPVVYQERNGLRVEVGGRFAVADGGIVSFIVNLYDPTLPLIVDPVLSYSTLLGGSSSDAATALAVDSTGAAYVAGFTASYDFPTGNPEQNFSAGGNDAFVAKLNAAGNGLVYCTYIGGRSDDRAYGIAIDRYGAAYVAGFTTSTNFPVRNAMQSKLAGAKNIFLLKLNAAGNTLVFSTYLGGGGSDAAYGIAVDAALNIYLVGDTTSVSLPATGFQKSNRGGQDAFVAKFASDGSRLLYLTYLGGSGDEHGAAIAVNSSSEAYVTGATWSTDFPVANPYQAHLAGGQDAFVARLNSAGTALVFSTFLGGTGGAVGYPEVGQAIALDSSGNAYIAGVTGSADFPLLHPLQASRLGATDAFIAKLTTAGALSYSTYLGGTGPDAANAIAVDSAGCAYVAGQTFSSDLPVLNSLQSASGGDYDAFWAKLSATGDSLLILSYLGGNGSDTATALALDGVGGLYIAGWTLSTNLPLLNQYQSVNTGNYGAFVAKILPSGGPPQAVSVSPSSGSGSSQTFTFAYVDLNGYQAIASSLILINNTLSASNGCYLLYYRPTNAVYLTNDAGTAWQTPLTLGQTGTLQNSQCTVNAANSSVSGSGINLTLNLALSFKGGFAGTKNIYMEVYEGPGDSGWQQRGTWTVPQAPPLQIVSVSPSTGTGSSQVFTFTYSDASGYQAIASSLLLVNATLTGASGCYLLYLRSANAIYLTNDAGTAWQAPLTLGQSGTLQNSQCSVNAANSSASGSGTGLTVNLSLAFTAAFVGAKNVYGEVRESASVDTGWQQLGSWTVPVALPQVVSVTPNTGSGASQVFTFAYSDSKGYQAIASSMILINNPLAAANGCYMLYYRPNNAVYLTNDAGTAWQGPLTLGQPGTLQNSQCTVNAAASSASGSGTGLTVTLSLSFKAAFNGARNIYAEAYEGPADSGWQLMGSWTVNSTQ